MSSSEIAIRVTGLGKCYEIYERPSYRLKQFILPRIQKLLNLKVKKYGHEFWALRDISFEVRKGQSFGIIGRNGSGKSTLLQLICGTLTPTSGFVEVSGRVAALLELGSGFNPEFTGRENVYLNASVFGLSKSQIDARFEEIVQFADIGEFIEQPVKMYSSGMLVRLAFAVIAHVDADILIIDEALAVGDAFFTQKCMRFIRNFMKNGTILFVSHDTNAVKSLCEEVLWVDNSLLRRVGSAKEICELYLETFFEVTQGVGGVNKQNNPPLSLAFPPEQPAGDQRQKYIGSSNLRNDLQIFEFDLGEGGIGAGDALIRNVRLSDVNGQFLSWAVGGELVVLEIIVETIKNLKRPIIGFFVKDRLGQSLFGDNTYLSFMNTEMDVTSGQFLSAQFTFHLPIFPVGTYSISAAVATGTQEDHTQQHWVHDALFFESHSSSVSTGLVGIQMHKIEMQLNKFE